MEITAMFSCQRVVQGAYQILSSWFQNIETTLEVQGAIQECPILVDHIRKERGMLRHSVNSILNQWISCSEVGNLVSQLHIQSMDQTSEIVGSMVTAVLSSEVLTSSRHKSALAGSI